MNALEQIKSTARNAHSNYMSRIESDQWMELSKHSPMSQENRENVRRALIRGEATIHLALTPQEREWLHEMGYPENLGQVVL